MIKQYLNGFSSLGLYYNKSIPGFLFRLVEGSIVDIAKSYDNVSYPGVEGVDAVVKQDGSELLFTCAESIREMPLHPLNVMNVLFDNNRTVYIDKSGCYQDMRERKLNFRQNVHTLSLTNVLEAAALVSLFGFSPSQKLIEAFSTTVSDSKQASVPEPFIQRLYLSIIVSGENPADALNLLNDCGAVELLWPELFALVGIDQAKEFHPEGDVWAHSLETLSHRKTTDLELSLSLLLHDLGKPLSVQVNGNKFNYHAQIGAKAAVGFLRRLDFPEKSIDKIFFLIENHMMPAAINSLPSFRTEKAMLNPHFPLLLEVYRCDLLSTFMGPDGYYEACKAYRAFIKHTKNPFRNSDGKKLLRMYVN